MGKGRIAGTLAALLIAAGCAVAYRPAMTPVADRAPFPRAQIERGAELAAIGDCAVCHRLKGGKPFAGGRGVPTPFGTVYATNITPDPDTGIGQWSEAAFVRAMRDGIARDGRHLYPVLPYPHFTRATDADIAALYAFVMTRDAVRQEAPANNLPFPMNVRTLMAGWNLLYLKPGPWQPDPAHDDTWNRGAYLAEAVGHCGACHTPHNGLGAEQAAQRFSGGEADHWYAPPLQDASPAAQPWTEDALANYLRTGFDAGHGAAAGPMTEVTNELAAVPENDIKAMAVYVASLMPKTVPVQSKAVPAANPVFAGACGGCHGADAPMTRSGAPPLSASTAVNAAGPRNVIQVILNGLPWHEGKAAPYMPGFAASLTDAQVADLATYLRQTYSQRDAWHVAVDQVAAIRRGS